MLSQRYALAEGVISHFIGCEDVEVIRPFSSVTFLGSSPSYTTAIYE